MKPLQALAFLLALGCLALSVVELSNLMETGTCASGGPYVSARPCPDGTGTQIMLLMAGIFGYVIFMLLSGQAVFLFGVLFLALGAAFIKNGMDDSSFAAVGYAVGGMFLLMGIFPVAFAIRGWLDRDETPSYNAVGLGTYTAMGNQGVVMATPPPAPRPTPVSFTPAAPAAPSVS